ncbi:type II toxin-antitoxin system RelB/DinJ family antitoxin [Haematobacter genomosp. 1]|uniref:Type II toxin-antitoxin system antitoxin, RelB/DinJ family n=1 Tax=Haematobacter genomosp. 1 TaxID=366618 RepID=A0A212AAE0_9RHOB|nr:type II toxin-antitoxin system RelB/DinJ family antitoxin [Haematobacter genomosp. 1]OWJ77134.1 type II toxin-antitoxin system antitoxin, RelB/DinJ family [Haematobacter genomosp. 1]
MPARTSMLHVRVDDQLKAQATEALAGVGLTLSDAVRILLTRVAREGGLPAGLAADPDAYDAWFRGKVREALAEEGPSVSHADVMAEMRERIAGKPRA